MAGPRVLHKVGDEMEMEKEKAKRFIDKGICEVVEVKKVVKKKKSK